MNKLCPERIAPAALSRCGCVAADFEVSLPQTIIGGAVTSSMERVETALIGGGQAGLAMSYHLAQRGCEHLVLERARVAERWRSERWDSLHFQFPNWSLALPGQVYAGDEPDGFAHKDDVVRFIERYAFRIAAPIRSGANVTALRCAPSGVGFELTTSQGRIAARHVVVATGPYQRPRLPRWSRELPADIVQLHARDYRRPQALPDGAVVVIGSGASGCQIADELLEAGRRTFLSVGRHRRLPRRYRGHDVFWWRREMGELDRTVDDMPPRLRPPPPLVTGVNGGYEVDLRRSAARGLRLCGHLAGVADGKLAWADDLQETLRAGNRYYRAFISEIDAHVARTGLDVSQGPDAEGVSVDHTHIAPLASPSTLDLHAEQVGAVIWATGYTLDFSWIAIPVFDVAGMPQQRRGTTSVPGLYFLGLHWMHKAKSSFLCGVGEDAAHIAACITGDAPQ
jgi:putative flavoprotein involved in K+ transport